MQHDNSTGSGAIRERKISRYVFVAFAAVAAYFLITEHRAHLFGVLPFLLLAACPLLHMFHHRGHDDGGRNDSAPQPGPTPGSGGDTHRH